MTIVKLKFDNDVKLNGRHFDPEIRRMLDVARLTAPPMIGNTIWVTSANDGKHKKGSKHFHNEAFDFRVRNIIGWAWGPNGEFVFNEVIDAWVKRIRFELGPEYDIIYGDTKHLDHFHLEYDPKKA